MDQIVYDVYENLERKDWWNLARRKILLSVSDNSVSELSNKKVADIGAGTGAFFRNWKSGGG